MTADKRRQRIGGSMVARRMPIRPGGQRTPMELQDIWWQISSDLRRIARGEPVAGLGDLPVDQSGFAEEKVLFVRGRHGDYNVARPRCVGWIGAEGRTLR